ncbi:hypothetical protein [Salinibaculum rarum]|uniref:hypothetical protein n=1 Tax=Salinibaculum rarum TaxID=3058903 RepID=UPI00265FA2BB|nr:hypothetical protein [Salinibaculum sp. KK48]
MLSPLSRLSNLLITIAVGPGILTHEYAHYAACKLSGVAVYARPVLRPFDDSAVLEHESVDGFGADLAIAVAPLLVNSLLAFGAFALAGASGTRTRLVFLWLGFCFGFTALPSATDTETLLRTAASLPAPARPVGYLVAYPLRMATLSVWATGILTFVWTMTLAGGAATM